MERLFMRWVYAAVLNLYVTVRTRVLCLFSKESMPLRFLSRRMGSGSPLCQLLIPHCGAVRSMAVSAFNSLIPLWT